MTNEYSLLHIVDRELNLSEAISTSEEKVEEKGIPIEFIIAAGSVAGFLLMTVFILAVIARKAALKDFASGSLSKFGFQRSKSISEKSAKVPSTDKDKRGQAKSKKSDKDVSKGKTSKGGQSSKAPTAPPLSKPTLSVPKSFLGNQSNKTCPPLSLPAESVSEIPESVQKLQQKMAKAKGKK